MQKSLAMAAIVGMAILFVGAYGILTPSSSGINEKIVLNQNEVDTTEVSGKDYTSLDKIDSKMIGENVSIQGYVTRDSSHRDYMNITSGENKISIIKRTSESSSGATFRDEKRGSLVEVEGTVVEMPKPKIKSENSNSSEETDDSAARFLTNYDESAVLEENLKYNNLESKENYPNVKNSEYWGSTRIGINTSEINYQKHPIMEEWGFIGRGGSICCLKSSNNQLGYIKEIGNSFHILTSNNRYTHDVSYMQASDDVLGSKIVKRLEFWKGKPLYITQSSSTQTSSKQEASSMHWGEEEIVEDSYKQSDLRLIGDRPVYSASEVEEKVRTYGGYSYVFEDTLYWGNEVIGNYSTVIEVIEHEGEPAYLVNNLQDILTGMDTEDTYSKVYLNGEIVAEAKDELIKSIASADGKIAYVKASGEERYVVSGDQKFGPYNDVYLVKGTEKLTFLYSKDNRTNIYHGGIIDNYGISESYKVVDPSVETLGNEIVYIRSDKNSSLLMRDEEIVYNGSIKSFNSIKGDLVYRYKQNGSEFVKINEKSYGPYKTTTEVIETDKGFFFVAQRKNGEWVFNENGEETLTYIFDVVRDVEEFSGSPVVLGYQTREVAGTDRNVREEGIIIGKD